MAPRSEEESPELVELRAEYDRELVRRAFRIGEMEQLVADVRAEYENSLSWRVTQPLRSAMDFVRQLRSR